MNKQGFLARLRAGLAGLPQDDREERLTFYSEMIDDRVEDGLSEEAAVAEMGTVEDIVAQTIAEIPLPRLVKERVSPGRRLRVWEIVLLILGVPVWLPLLLAAGAVLLAVYVVIWVVILSLWVTEVALIASAFACAVAAAVYVCTGFGTQALLALSGTLVLAGLSIFFVFGRRAATRGAVLLTRGIVPWLKSRFLRKEGAK